MGIGAGELLIILLVVLIVFGAGRLGDIGGAIPKAVKNFQAGSRGELADEPRPSVSRSTSAVARPARRARRLRPVGLLVMGLALLVLYAELQWLQTGLPLQVAAGLLGALGALLYIFF